MLNSTNAQQHGTPSVIEDIIRVKGGDLAPKGKGTLAISVMRDGKVSLNATLPSESGVPEPLDFTSLERLELVSTRRTYKGKQWIIPIVTTFIASLGAPILSSALGQAPPIIIWGYDTSIPFITIPYVKEVIEVKEVIFRPFLYAGLTGVPYVSGLYAGSKLSRVVRFVAVASDGRHCVGEMPETAFYFVQGVRSADKEKTNA